MESLINEYEALHNREKVILDKMKEVQSNEEQSNPKKRKLRSDTEMENMQSRIEWLLERYEWQSKQCENLRLQNKKLCAEKSEKFNAVKRQLEERFGDAFRERNEAIQRRDELIRQRDEAIIDRDAETRAKDEAILQRDDALDTTCSICIESGCFVGRICGNNCSIKCCINCFVDLGKNRHWRCPGCRGDFSDKAVLENRVLNRKLATPVYLANPTTPRNRVLDSMHYIMQGQLPELTPQQVSRRLDDLFAQAPTTVTEMFENALTPTPATPAANVSGSNSFVVNGTTYYTD
jgi:hypothetical protein